MKELKFIKKYIKKNNVRLIAAWIFEVLDAFLSLLTPLVFSFFLDYVLGSEISNHIYIQEILNFFGGKEFLQQNLWIGAIIVISIYFINSLVMFLKSYMSGSTAEEMTYRIRNDLYMHIQHLPFLTMSSLKIGDVIQRCTSDLDQIRRTVSTQVGSLFNSFALAVFASIVLVSINPRLALISLACVPFIIYYAYRLFDKTQQVFAEFDESEADMTTFVQENLSGVRVVKAFNREVYELERFGIKSEHHRKVTLNFSKILGQYWATSDFICMLQIAVVIFVGVSFATVGEISVGSLFIFISYVSSILWPIRNLGRLIADIGKSSVSIERINEILNMEQEDLVSGIETKIQGEIEFSNVSFSYENAKEKGLNNISFKINAGETLAILGPTGSGKSTLIYLLMRFFENTSGEIKIDGIPLSDINKSSLRNQIGLVLQEPFLFSKTILDNIKLGQDDVSIHNIENAANLAAVHEVISSFDQGYETLVGEKGVTLSGGQKQRVSMARTLLKKTPILVLDDSLSAVDSETDLIIRQHLNSLDHQPTKMIITQRISTMMDADAILVVEDGKVTQWGNHTQLIEEDGLYRRIYDIQKQRLESEGNYE
ncbi:MAG: ABC transporter ATP-binding protein [Anaerorhabdus sp.]